MPNINNLLYCTALASHDLLANPGDTDLAELTVNIALHSVAGMYLTYYDGCALRVCFAITYTRFCGSYLAGPDPLYWQEPAMSSWSSLEEYCELFSIPPEPEIFTFRDAKEYRQQFPEKVPLDALEWEQILPLYRSVKVVREHQTKDILEIIEGSGEEIVSKYPPGQLLIELE